MSIEMLNKIQQTHSQFKKITLNLNQLLGIQFGYMKIFKDGSYYSVMEDLDCLTKFVTKIEESCVFCERNVTNCFDGNYNFTLWPREPNCLAMDIYYNHRIWNGITVSKKSKDYIELYWFTQKEAKKNWHKFFIINKSLLLEFINYFNFYKDSLYIPTNNNVQNLFKFKNGFEFNLPKSEYIEKYSSIITTFLDTIHLALIDGSKPNSTVSPRENEVLKIIGQGYTAKIAAQKLLISVGTIRYHLEHIKEKTGLHTKMDLIKFYQESRL